PNYPLIRERCSYQPPTLPKPPRQSSIYEWKFEAPFGIRFGTFCYRSIAVSTTANDNWVDVFQRPVHLAGFLEAQDFAAAVIFNEGCFAVCLVRPPEDPRLIFRSSARL